MPALQEPRIRRWAWVIELRTVGSGRLSDAGARGLVMEFRLLGGIEARVNGEPVDLGPARQRTVLVALLMDVNRTVPTDQLVYRVWGEDPARRATDTLYSYLSRLRRVLPAPSVDIHRRSGGYAVVADELSVDVHRFRHLIEEAHRAADDPVAAAAFRQALAVWRGTPFAGVDTPWFNAARDALNREREAAELDRVDVRLRLGEHTALLAALAERSAAHPLDERLAAQYMLALYRCGRQADALAHYRHIRAVLADELGLDPDRDLQRLHEAILAGDTELSPAVRPGPQAAAAPAPAAAPTTASPRVGTAADPAGPIPSYLPLDVRGFVGRDAELDELDGLLSAGSPAGIAILAGTAGSTRQRWRCGGRTGCATGSRTASSMWTCVAMARTSRCRQPTRSPASSAHSGRTAPRSPKTSPSARPASGPWPASARCSASGP